MPDLVEQMYCSQQINIPPNLPFILKQYAKAVIRTQPRDLLFWSVNYFRAKAQNLPPPVKDRIEFPSVDSPSGLSPGFIKVLQKQLGHLEYVNKEVLYEKWLGVCLKEEALTTILKLGHFVDDVFWLHFLAIAAAYISPTLTHTMSLICELLTDEPDGGSAMISVETFNSLYMFLARLDCGLPQIVQENTIKDSVNSLTKEIDSEESLTIIKEEKLSNEMDIEVDSHDGIMIWPDIAPTKVRSRESSFEGAISEDGLMVVDDVTKVSQYTDPKSQALEAMDKSSFDDDDVDKHEPEESIHTSQEFTSTMELTNMQAPEISKMIKTKSCFAHNQKALGIKEKSSTTANIIPFTKSELETEKNDFDKEISSLPSTQYLGIIIDGVNKSVGNEQEGKDKKIQSSSTLSSNFETNADKKLLECIPGIGPIIPEDHIQAVIEYMNCCADKQEGMVMLRNIRHFLCPPLDYPDASNNSIIT
uniref:RIIa domain-containing protein n=1 Tax=Clastoptera arizonana TaxID=38151 RepID=A0A1B6EH90_9HEMI